MPPAEFCYELFEVCCFPLLLRRDRLLVGLVLRPHSYKGIVVPAVVPQPLSLHEDRVPRYRVEERAVVRNHNNRAFPLGEKLLQPGHRVHIEVVGGLVEEEEIGFIK